MNAILKPDTKPGMHPDEWKTRLESGALIPRLQWADVEDLISTSLDAAHRRLR